MALGFGSDLEIMKLLLFSIFSLLLFGQQVDPPFTKQVNKKLEQTFADLWPEQPISPGEINIKDLDVSFSVEDRRLFTLKAEGQKVAYLYMGVARSQHNFFDYAVIFNLELAVQRVVLLVYREDYGGEIGSKRWLRQFEDKTTADKIRIGEDIQGISGATISSNSATAGIGDMLREMQVYKQKNILP